MSYIKQITNIIKKLNLNILTKLSFLANTGNRAKHSKLEANIRFKLGRYPILLLNYFLTNTKVKFNA